MSDITPQGQRTKKLFVGGLSLKTTQEEFKNHWDQFGTVVSAVIMLDNLSRKSRGFGFVTFDEENVVDHVLSRQHVLNGKPVELKRAIPKEKMPSTPSPSGGGGSNRGYDQRGPPYNDPYSAYGYPNPYSNPYSQYPNPYDYRDYYPSSTTVPQRGGGYGGGYGGGGVGGGVGGGGGGYGYTDTSSTGPYGSTDSYGYGAAPGRGGLVGGPSSNLSTNGPSRGTGSRSNDYGYAPSRTTKPNRGYHPYS